MKSGALAGRVLVISLMLWGPLLTGCQTSSGLEKNGTKTGWALPLRGGYRVALRGNLTVSTGSPIARTVELEYQAALTLRVERVISTVVCVVVTLDQHHVGYQPHNAGMIAPLLARLRLPAQGSQITLWLDSASGEVLSYDTGTGARQLTRAETTFAGLAVFPLLGEFVPVRAEFDRPVHARILYHQRVRDVVDGQDALISTLGIESPETPDAAGKIRVIQLCSVQSGRPLATRVMAEFVTRTRIPSGGVRLVVPLQWRINGLAEYVPL